MAMRFAVNWSQVYFAMTDTAATLPIQLFQSILDGASVLAIFALDRDYRYLALNDRHRQMMKEAWNIEPRVGQSILADVIGTDEVKAQAKLVLDRALAGERFTSVNEYGGDPERQKTYEGRYAPLANEQGEVFGVVCALRDITEEHKTQLEREKLRGDLARQNEELLQSAAENAQLVERLRIAVTELTTPVLELWESVLAMPIVGIVDTERGEQMSVRLLDAIEKHRARFVILDLTGVNNLDTSTANRFMQLARAVSLLGSEAIIAGIQSAVAQTLVSIGVDLKGLRSTRNLKQALEYCIARRNKQTATNPGPVAGSKV